MVVTDRALSACPVCGRAVGDAPGLAAHLIDEAERSDGAHVMWLNRHVTKHRTDPAELAELLVRWSEGVESAAADRVRR